MKRFDAGLVTKIALLVICVEVVAFGALGWFYTDRFSDAVDQRARTRMQLVAQLVGEGALNVHDVAQTAMMSELLGAPYLRGMILGGNGRVIVSTDPAILGLRAGTVAGFDPRWIAPSAPEEQFIAAGDTLSYIVRLRGALGGPVLYHALFTIDTETLSAEKRAIVVWGWAGSLLFVFLSSIGIVFLSHRLINRRVNVTLRVLKQVEEGDIEARIPVDSSDEIGLLQGGINAMTAEIGSLLNSHRINEEELGAILKSIGDGVIAIDTDGRVRHRNPRAESLLRIGREGGERRRITDFLPVEEGRVPPWQRALEEGRVGSSVLRGVEDAEGNRISIDLSCTPIRDHAGNLDGAVLVLRDVTERERYEEGLRQAKEAAETASRTKSEFLAVMSHEIRTPMNAIIGMGEMIAETTIDEEARKYLYVQQRAASGLLELLDDLLDLSRIEAGKMVFRSAPFDVSELLGSVQEIIGPAARGKGLGMEIVIASEVPVWVAGDKHRLRQILLNLVGNSVKFTERGHVHVKVEREAADRLLFEVSDTGIGIAPEAQERIFSPFTQADSSMTRRYGGSGLGLTIVQHLVQQLGGRIELKSAPGEGTTFRISIPFQPGQPESSVPSGERARLRLVDAEKGLSVLLAEDSEDNALLIQSYLKRTPHRLVAVGDGAQAVERVKSEPFDVILMDMQMPVMDGYEATRAIRELERELGRKAVPILALTAHAMEEDEGKSLEAGCNMHLTKPIKKKELLEALARAAATADGLSQTG